MSDEERLETVHAVYERWGRGDFASWTEPYDENTELVLRSEFPDAGTYRGLSAIAEYMRNMLTAWDRLVIEPREVRPCGKNVLVRVLQRGTGKSSGVVTEFAYFMVWTFDGPRATRVESIVGEEDALAAAGADGGAG